MKLKIFICSIIFIIAGSVAGLSPVLLHQAVNAPVSACVGYVGIKTTIEGGEGTGATHLHYITKFTQSGTCKINTLEFYNDDTDATAVILTLYKDSNKALLAYTGALTPSAGYDWTLGTLNTEVTLENGAVYYIGFYPNNTISYKYDASGENLYENSGYPTLVNPWVATYTNTRKIAIRGSYVP